jgi:hypothetical protein
MYCYSAQLFLCPKIEKMALLGEDFFLKYVMLGNTKMKYFMLISKNVKMSSVKNPSKLKRMVVKQKFCQVLIFPPFWGAFRHKALLIF